MIATSSGSLSVVGKAAYFDGGDQQMSFGAFCKVVRPNNLVLPRYLSHFFLNENYRQRISALATGANINNLRNEHLDGLKLSLPLLSDQQRIVAVLDRAAAIRARRRDALHQADELQRAIFVDEFGDPATNPKAWSERRLDQIADIRSGITKGRKSNGEPLRPVPYMRVANVQDGHIDLSEVKIIEATEAEIARYALQAGDILLTEGGDPDKLGRGAVWTGEIAECIHQNHIFVVRLHSGAELSPAYVSALLGSARGKRYFLRSAKQTTGIASINRTQLAAFPVLVPRSDVHARWLRANSRVVGLQSRIADLRGDAEQLYSSLSQRAFRGDL